MKLRSGHELTADLAARIRGRIRTEASPRHVPHRVHKVEDIPYTLNGKRVEGAARAALERRPVRNVASLANAYCLVQYKGLERGNAL